MARREDGYTLIELVVVLTLVGILLTISLGLYQAERESAVDAAARVELRIAATAAEAYHAENGGYEGMTTTALGAVYSPGATAARVVSASADGYCLASTVRDRTWYAAGPGEGFTTTPCR